MSLYSTAGGNRLRAGAARKMETQLTPEQVDAVRGQGARPVAGGVHRSVLRLERWRTVTIFASSLHYRFRNYPLYSGDHR